MRTILSVPSVALIAYILLLGIGIFLNKFIHFSYRDSNTIYGWIHQNHYQKQQEFFFYVLAVIVLPLLVASIAYLWKRFFMRRILYVNSETSLGKKSFFGRTKQMQSNTLYRFLKCVFIPIILYFYIYEHDVHGNIDFYHEGENLVPLQVSIRGGLPYHDVYFQHGVIRNFYLPLIFSKTFGETLEGIRRGNRLIEPLGYMALYFLGVSLFRWSLLSSVLLVILSSSQNFWIEPRLSMSFLAVALVTFWLQNLDKKVPGIKGKTKIWLLFLSGVFSSVSFWHSVDIGIYTLCALGLFLFLQTSSTKTFRPLICWLLGVTIGLLIGIIYFITLGVFGDLVKNLYAQCAYQLLVWGLPFPSLVDAFEIIRKQGLMSAIQNIEIHLYLTVLVFSVSATVIAVLAVEKKILRGKTQNLLLITLCGMFFYRSALGRPDWAHWVSGSAFQWVILIFSIEETISFLWKQFQCKSTKFLTAWSGLIFVICCSFFIFYVHIAHNPIQAITAKLSFPHAFSQTLSPIQSHFRLGNVTINREQKKSMSKVVQFIVAHSNENDYIFDFSNQGAYYFFANRKVPTRYFHVIYAANRKMENKLIRDLENNTPRVVIFKSGNYFDQIDGISNEIRCPNLSRYLRENFKTETIIGDTLILTRD